MTVASLAEILRRRDLELRVCYTRGAWRVSARSRSTGIGECFASGRQLGTTLLKLVALFRKA